MIKVYPNLNNKEFSWLTAGHIGDCMELERRVVDKLPQGCKHFIVPLSEERRRDIFKQGHLIAGYFIDGELVAQVILNRLDKLDILSERYEPISGMAPNVQPGDYYIINALVNPQWQKCSILVDLLNWARVELYFENDVTDANLWATISIENMPALSSFKKLGFQIKGEGLLSKTNAHIYLVHSYLLEKVDVAAIDAA